jgi:cytochrome c-type biogenesis protein CcmH/NrfG
MDKVTASSNIKWRPVQAYGLAGLCLFFGLPLGYLIRASVPTPASAAKVEAVNPASPTAMPSLDDMKRMADKQAEPLVNKLKETPNDPQLLIQAGNIYMRTHQFTDAIPYYQKALQSDPKNFAVRADLSSCLYYTGDSDGALKELQKTLNYDPNQPGTLLNIGIIKWKGKNDAAGAIATWQKLLKANPKFERKEQVQHLIEMARQTSVTTN